MLMIASALFLVRKLFQSYASDRISLVYCQKAVSVLRQWSHQLCSLSESCYGLTLMIASALFIVRKLFQSYASHCISLVHCQKAVSVLCLWLHQPCSLSETYFSIMQAKSSALFIVQNICFSHTPVQRQFLMFTVRNVFQSYASDIVSLVHCHK